MKKVCLLRYAGGILLFILGVLASRYGMTGLSFVLFMACAAGEAVLCYLERRRILDLRLLLSLSWISAIGLSRLNLSLPQTPFSVRTWLSMGLFYFCFMAAYDLSVHLRRAGHPGPAGADPENDAASERIPPVQMSEKYQTTSRLNTAPQKAKSA